MKLFLHTKDKNNKYNRGFAMLFAVLVSSVLLSIGVSIFNLTVKELVLSASGRESQFAFFAADTGVECALYWDFKGIDIFATSSSQRTPSNSTPDCVNTIGQPAQLINISPTISNSISATTQFDITIPNISGNYCSVVTVTKNSSTGIIITTIDSRGYNTCIVGDPNRIERALTVTY